MSNPNEDTIVLKKARLRVGGLLIGLLTVLGLVVIPASPAAAIDVVYWNQAPASSIIVGQTVSMNFSGTANTSGGPRIIGCFIRFSDGNNYSNRFGGVFGGTYTSGNCYWNNRSLNYVGIHTIVVGFNLNNGGSMSTQTTVDVQAPTPSVSVPSEVSTPATTADGAIVTFDATASDFYYGAAVAECAPASGSFFAVGATQVTCSATNQGGKTGQAQFVVNVTKEDPVLLWTPPASVPYGTTYGDLSTAQMESPDATGTIEYSRVDGIEFSANDVIPMGDDQELRAAFAPSSDAAIKYFGTATVRSVSVVAATSAVSFADGSPMDKQFGDAPFTVTATGTTGGGVVTLSAQDGSDCSVESSASGDEAVATVTLTGAGACVLLADQAATSTHLAAPTAQWSVTIAKANPTITWSTPAKLTQGDRASALFTASANVAGTFTYLVDGVAVGAESLLDLGTARTVSVTFVPENSEDYVEATATKTFDVVLPAAKLAVSTPKRFTTPGATVKLAISNLAPNERFSISLRGKVLAEGTASDAGKRTVSVTIPKKTPTGKAVLVVTGSTEKRTGKASQTVVSTSRKLTFSLSPRPIVESNRELKITVHRLAAGEPVKVTFRGKRVSPTNAKADRYGNYTVKVSAGWSWGYKEITATGSAPKRFGVTRIDVEARR